MLPDFIVVGAPKAGTTSLYHYLAEHPEVYMSEPKEVNYFSCDEIQNQGLYYNDYKTTNLKDYENLFANVTDEKVAGEGSVSYLFYPQTPAKIKELLPDVKIIILLRDPVDRGFSHYLMDYRLGLIDLSYEEIIYQTGVHKNLHLYYQQYVELGLYYEQVKRYLDLFGEGQVKIYLQEDLRSDAKSVVRDLYAYLGIEISLLPDVERNHNVFSMPKSRITHKLYSSHTIRSMVSAIFSASLKDKIKNHFFETKQKPVLGQHIIDYLHGIYLPDIQNLEHLLGKDLSKWYDEDAR